MSAWTIRDARADDAETIVALVHRLNLDEGNPPGG